MPVSENSTFLRLKIFEKNPPVSKLGHMTTKNSVQENSLTSSSLNYVRTIPKVQIHNIVPYIKGELWYSYLGRLAICNGFSSVRDFIYEAGYIEKPVACKLSIGYDCNKPVADILKIDGAEWMLDATTLRAYEPLYSSIPFGQLVYSHGWEVDKYSKVFSRPRNHIQKLRVCPECVKEDEEFYYHVEHQLPLVDICPKHGCALMEYTGKQYYEITNKSFSPVTPSPLAEDFAVFIPKLCQQDLQCTLQDTNTAIYKQMAKLGIDDMDIRSANYPLGKFEPYIAGVRFTVSPFNTTRVRVIAPIKMYPLLILLFGTAEKFAEAVKEINLGQEEKRRFLEALQTHGFSLVSDYRRDLVRIKCPDCGREIAAMPKYFLSGWFCPYCDSQLDEALFIRVLKTSIRNLKKWFVVDGEIKNWSSRIKLIDKDNNSEIKISVNDFVRYGLEGAAILQNGAQIKTETDKRHWSFNDYAQRIESLGDFTLLQLKKEKKQYKLKIRHNKCGHDFTCYWSNFVESAFCRVCGRDLEKKQRIPAPMQINSNEEKWQIVSFVRSKKNEVITNKELYSLFPRQTVQTTLSGLAHNNGIKRLGVGVFCNVGEDHSLLEIFEATCRYREIVGCPICDLFLLELGLTTEASNLVFCIYNPTRDTHSSQKRVIGFNKYDCFYYMGEITEANKLAVEFVMSVQNMSLISSDDPEEFLIKALNEIRKRGISNQAIIEAAKPLHSAIRLKIRNFVYGGENVN